MKSKDAYSFCQAEAMHQQIAKSLEAKDQKAEDKAAEQKEKERQEKDQQNMVLLFEQACHSKPFIPAAARHLGDLELKKGKPFGSDPILSSSHCRRPCRSIAEISKRVLRKHQIKPVR